MKLFSGILMDNQLFIDELVEFYDNNKVTVLSCLPWLAGEIADQTDFCQMLVIINDFGGRKVYIPKKPCRLASKLDIPVNDLLHRKMRQGCDDRGFVEFPSLWGIYVAARRAAMLTSINEGCSKIELIERYGATERGLRNLTPGTYKAQTSESINI
ncbi:hypothetical protein EDC56_2476 [Sinobacterium caligoides]|uniref:Mor transcription activator family protein n=1 Tax=Sinobacterium caligoides TaxID=933926 RepID=A0A3N2DQC6_9GAMM|nr:hypothetical protein [Sinobacterium caligoides]ROS02026.1 hypothetical protein EDC56_2476 [Sinobacterium caligoides]